MASRGSSAPIFISIGLCVLLLFAGSVVTSSKSTSSVEPCDCSSDCFNCKDFPLSNGVTAQDCYDYCIEQGKGDIHKLDRDKDDLACEKN